MSANAMLGYTGAHEDPITCGYLLGNGYRLYLPALMRFNAPDSFSPFWLGGANPYVYCADDPINHVDPSGHMFLSEVAAEFAEIGESSITGAFKREDQPLPVKYAQTAAQPGTSKGFSDAAPSTSYSRHAANDPVGGTLPNPDGHAQANAAPQSSINEIDKHLGKMKRHMDEIELQMVHLTADEIIFKFIDDIANSSINENKITGVVTRHYDKLAGVMKTLDNVDAELELARNDLRASNRAGIVWGEDMGFETTINRAHFRMARLRISLDRLLGQARAEQGAFWMRRS